MGRIKREKDENYTFVPQISAASKKLALRRLESLNRNEQDENVPHFMLNIKCRSREPLAPISQETYKFDKTLVKTGIKPKETASAPQPGTDSENNSTKLAETNIDFPKDKTGYHLRTGMNKTANVMLDDSIFTFRPKVSSASAKIVENLGTDFMSRQQQHIERQKRNVSPN